MLASKQKSRVKLGGGLSLISDVGGQFSLVKTSSGVDVSALAGSFKLDRDGNVVWQSDAGLAAPVIGELIRRLDQMARDLSAAQDALVEQSAAEERRRIARELHDVIAHTLLFLRGHLISRLASPAG